MTDLQIMVNEFISCMNAFAIIAFIVIRLKFTSLRTTGFWAFMGAILIAMGVCNSWLFVHAGFTTAPQTVSGIVSVALAALGLRFFGNWLLETPVSEEPKTEKDLEFERLLAKDDAGGKI